MTQNLQTVLRELLTLSADERRDLGEILARLPADKPTLSEQDLLDQLLLQRGVVSRLPAPPDPAAYRRWQPVTAEGKPLSETIIEERR